jgi:hypothetical protein
VVYWAFNQNGGEGGIRTPGRSFSPYNGLANRRLQPLGHLSVANRRKHYSSQPLLVTVSLSLLHFGAHCHQTLAKLFESRNCSTF